MTWSRGDDGAWARTVGTQMRRGRQLGSWFESAGLAEGAVWLLGRKILDLSLCSPLSPLWSQEEQMRQKDSRARLTSCLLRNMRAVKCHGWEDAFLERVLRIRGQELGALRTSGLLFSVSLVSFQLSTFLVMSPWSPCRVWAGGGGVGGGG